MIRRGLIKVTYPTYMRILNNLDRDGIKEGNLGVIISRDQDGENIIILESENPDLEIVILFISPSRLGSSPDNYLLIDPEGEHVEGRVIIGGEEYIIDEMKIVGPGFLKIFNSFEEGNNFITYEERAEEEILFSRAMPFFGINAWNRWRLLRVALIGASGMGTDIAVKFVKSGIGQLSIWDPDFIEPHIFNRSPYNLYEHYTEKNKALLLKDFLKDKTFMTEVYAYPDTILKVYKYAPVIAKHDVIVLAVDSPSARAAASILGTLFLVPVIDVSTGFDRETEGIRILWTFPYETDLFCYDESLLNQEVLQELLNLKLEHDRNLWYMERKGSFYGHIGVAAGETLMLLRDILKGRVIHSGILEIQWRNGSINVEQKEIENSYRRRCIPAHLLGAGFKGMSEISAWLKNRAKTIKL